MKGTRVGRLALLMWVVFWWNKASAIITIDSVRATPSNCANDGTIRVFAGSPTSMLYAIVDGPDIRPQQSGNSFSALPTGNYKVMVTNFSNDTGLVNAVVGGVYDFPDFAPSFTNPICPGSYTGTIIGNANNSTGRAPFKWELTNIATNATATQASDTFTGLNGGDYRVRMFDSCQNFATRYVTLVDPISTFSVDYIIVNNMIGCDTDIVTIPIYSTQAYWSVPFIVTIWLNGFTKTDTIYSVPANGVPYFYIYDTIVGPTYGAGGYVQVTNGCGETVWSPHWIDTWGPTVQFVALTDSCNPRVKPNFYLSTNFPSRTAFHAPITMQVWDNTVGTKIDSTVFNYSVTSFYPDYFLELNHSYRMSLKDECGNTFQQNFTTPVGDTTRVYVDKAFLDACLDSAGTVNIHCVNYSPTTTTLTITSGPAVTQSTKPYFSHYDSITYPASDFIRYHCGGYNPNAPCFGISGLSMGTYTFRAEDDCGHLYNGSFTIDGNDISVYDYKHQVIRGCPGQNKISYLIHRNKNNTIQDKMRLFPLGSTFAIDSITSDSATFSNLNAGTYVLEHYVNLYHNFDQVNPGLSCNTLRDTIVVPPYQTPKIGYATQIKCNGTVNVGLQPDSAFGVPPYTYEILSGPVTSSVQASNFFTLTQPGIYAARISDTCGFARTFTFSVDTLAFQQIVKVGSSCVGNTAILTAQHSPYATYQWQRPDGTFFSGDSLILNPVKPTDYGIYLVKKMVNVNACRDTFYTTYTLNSTSITNLYDTICSGRNVVFAGIARNLAGVYFDTIATTLCDSIVAFHLQVTGSRDSISRTICSGQSIIIGSHTYSTPGIYHDTITTSAGCDSIIILTLSTGAYKQDSVNAFICEGQSIVVGPHTYSVSGIYRDTFATTGCDSIHILNLQVNLFKRDSGSHTICQGQSITVGQHTYSNTGVYRDTFATAGCDSIYTLTLQVSTSKRDSVVASICTGQNIAVGPHIYTATGIYRDTFPTTGCDSIHILNLLVAETKQVSETKAICEGESVTVGIHAYSASGVYRDTFATPACDSIYILTLQVNPVRQFSETRMICAGQSVKVGMHTYTTAGIYRDTIATSQCDSIHILTLQVADIIMDSMQVAVCEGDSITIDGKTYRHPGIYRDTFPTGYCDSVFSVYVYQYSRSSIHITASGNSVTPGDSIQLGLSGDGISSYNWSPASILSNPFIAVPVATIHEPVWIVVMATDANNCAVSDSIYISVPDCTGYVFVPNAFTPNGDGNNEEFRLYGPCIKLNYLYIFNRWGEKVWETSDMGEGWDGRYKGELQPVGVYVYIVNYSDGADSIAKELKGSLTLIR